MSDYRRAIVPGGTFFLTLVTYRRTPLFSESENVFRLRVAVAQMLTERPFKIIGAVILPEHIHFLWRLPPNDSDYTRSGMYTPLKSQVLDGVEKADLVLFPASFSVEGVIYAIVTGLPSITTNGFCIASQAPRK
jgi:hypothetical protein